MPQSKIIDFILKVYLVSRKSSSISTESIKIKKIGLRRRERRQHIGDSCVEFRRHRIDQRLRCYNGHLVF